MSEIFKLARPAIPMPFTGERLTSDIHGEIEYEHFHRYFYARELCRDKRVLDVASGEGYGTFLLAGVARSVHGLELAADACKYATTNYVRNNLIFCRGDARSLPFPDGLFDVVTSFETIEHFYEHEQFLQEIRRVLCREGLLIVSSPDRDFYSGLNVKANPYHVRELTRLEFRTALSAHFTHTALFRHRFVSASLIVPDAENVTPHSLAFERRDEDHYESNHGLPRASYLLAVSSNAPLPELPLSLFIDQTELERRENSIQHLRQVEIPERDQQVQNLQQQLQLRQAEILERDQQVQNLQQQLQQVRESQAAAEQELASSKRFVQGLREQLTEQRTTRAAVLADARAENGHLRQELAIVMAETDAISMHLQRLLSSTSWKMTYPARRFLQRRVEARRWVRRGLTLVNLPVAEPQPELRVPHFYPLADRWYDGETPEVSIIVLNYNKSERTITCLESIWQLTAGVRYEIVVLDNGSTPEEYARLKQAGGPSRIIRLEVNRYFGEGNNIAVEQARGELICLLNNDTTVTNRWLGSLVAALRSNKQVSAVGPKFVYPDGRLQEAGALLMPDATVRQIGKGGNPTDPEYNVDKEVHYVSAACLLMPRMLFLEVGGFDLVYEPAYYEDLDLCFKLRELGGSIRFCHSATVIHDEHTSQREVPGIVRQIEANRSTFLNRWQRRLSCPSESHIRAAFPHPALASGDDAKSPQGIGMTHLRGGQPAVDKSSHPVSADTAVLAASRRRAMPEPADAASEEPQRRAVSKVVMYLTYGLMLGGGERFLLTLASHLLRTWDVSIATAHPYSRARLLNLAATFGLDVRRANLLTIDAVEGIDCDVFIVLGNELVPPLPLPAGVGIYVCQFPFPMSEAYVCERLTWLQSYQRVIVYSDFVRRHYLGQAREYSAPEIPVSVVWPPIEEGQLPIFPAHVKLNRVLNIGRFFGGGHKRQDLLIKAFRSLCETCSAKIELHLVGSVHIGTEHQAFLTHCRNLAQGLPVFFHLNADQAEVGDLLGSSSVYWHGTGMEADETTTPWALEHFGISVGEAMNAGCIAMAPNCGGPQEIIEDRVTGYLFENETELVELTRAVFEGRHPEAIQEMRRKAIEAGRRFSREAFCQRWDQVIRELTQVSSPSEVLRSSSLT